MNTIRRADNQGGIIFRPAEGQLWVTPGPMAPERTDEYVRLDVAESLAAPVSTSPRHSPARSS